MCLSVPARIIQIEDGRAKAELGGLVQDVSIDLCPEVEIGDYVLIHAGFAIQRLDEKEARETLDLLKGLLEDP